MCANTSTHTKNTLFWCIEILTYKLRFNNAFNTFFDIPCATMRLSATSRKEVV